MKRVLDTLAGSLTGFLLAAVILLAAMPRPLEWSKTPLPTPRSSQPADLPSAPGSMTTDIPVPSPDRAGRTRQPDAASGTASWYCGAVCTSGYPAGGLYAAAGPALRVGKWRGRVVTVELADGSAAVRVRLVDSCACGGGRVLDLYAAAFSRLAPLSRGVVPVRVRWGGTLPTPPPTTTEVTP